MTISHTMPQRRFSLGGECVYCGNSFEVDQLTDEHIVPLTLSGDWVIEDGACKPCANLSNELYEGEALQSDMIRVPRAIMDLKRRRAKKKGPLVMPPLFPHGAAGMLVVGDLEHRRVEIADYPPIFMMLVIEPAAILAGEYQPRVKPRREKLRLWLRYIQQGKPTKSVVSDEIIFPGRYDGDEPVMIAADYEAPSGGKASLRQKLNFNAFGLMLAKIAYTFGVVERGRDAFEGNEIRDLLNSERDDVFNFVGGSLNGERLTDRHLHYLAIRERDGWLTVIVHLFSSYGAPPYEVVLGKLK